MVGLIMGLSLFARSTALVEDLYVRNIYRTLMPPLSRLTGVLPFSLAEIIMVVLVLWLLIELIVALHRRSRDQSENVFASLLTSVIVIGLLYLSFQCLWGLNYHRQQFAKAAGLDTRPFSNHELVMVAETLADQVNQLRAQVPEDSDGIMQLAPSQREVLDQGVAGYTVLVSQYPQLEGRYGRPKGLILSAAISYTGIYGFFIPFTGEANVNTDIPDSMLPFSICHEMAHQRGMAREDEANFIAYLSCCMNPHGDFKYSGNLFALSYTLGALRERDEKSFQKIRNSLAPGVVRDLGDIRQFAERHRGPWNRFFEKVNDTYLKANSQTAGIQSYEGIVDLLVAAHRQHLF